MTGRRKDKLLGRKSRYNWGRNSKRELRYIETQRFKREVHEELAQDKDDKTTEEENERYEEWLKNHWVNVLLRQRDVV